MVGKSYNMNIDNLEEVKELLEHALESRSWPAVEDALSILNEELGYDSEKHEDESNED